MVPRDFFLYEGQMKQPRILFGCATFAVLFSLSACSTNTTVLEPTPKLTPRQTAFLDTLEQRTFNWFWEKSDANNGLTPDRWPTKSFSSVAAVGFALTAYPVGVERGYVSRTAAADRVLSTLRFMYNAPQGPQASEDGRQAGGGLACSCAAVGDDCCADAAARGRGGGSHAALPHGLR